MTQAKELGEYVLERRIGEGRITEVCLAFRKHGVPEPLVLKRLRVDAALDEGVTALFLEEARQAARVLHANLAQVVDVGVAEGAAFLVEEHVDGVSLEALTRTLASRQELLPIEVCVDLAIQLTRALAALHDEAGPVGGVHGAVSPWSVMVRHDGALKLTDFGAERVATRLAGVRAGLAQPRYGYLAPEVLRGEAFDGRADQHAVGVLLWELLTGRRLFHATGEAAARENVLVAPVPPPSSIRRSVPAALDEVVLRALARAPERRFPDVAALEHALESVVPPLGVDDREARARAELERLTTRPAAEETAPAPRFAAVDPAALEVEHTVAGGPDGGADLDARAIPLEGPTRTASARRSVRGTSGRRSRGVAALLGLALVAGAAFVVWRFPDALRALPGAEKLLPNPPSSTDERGEAAAPDKTRAPVAKPNKPRAPADEAKADRLEQRAATLLLEGENGRALAALRQAAELSPDRASLQRKLAMGYRALGERYLAKRHLERYLALEPRASDRASVEALIEELSRDE